MPTIAPCNDCDILGVPQGTAATVCIFIAVGTFIGYIFFRNKHYRTFLDYAVKEETRNSGVSNDHIRKAKETQDSNNPGHMQMVRPGHAAAPIHMV